MFFVRRVILPLKTEQIMNAGIYFGLSQKFM
jgi:hypothetical protein